MTTPELYAWLKKYWRQDAQRMKRCNKMGGYTWGEGEIVMQLDWHNCGSYIICRVPEGKMYAYVADAGYWYIPLAATKNHDGILPFAMTKQRYDTAEAAQAAIRDWYIKSKEQA